MRRDPAIALVAIGLWCGCKFSSPSTGDDDAAIPVTIGFANATTLSDEQSGSITIPVILSAPSSDEVSVDYHFSGGTATEGADYNASDGTVTIAPGQTMGGIPLTILPDGLEEPDETIEITLDHPMHGDLGTAMNVVTISANILPRISFTTDMLSGAEGAAVMITVQLDKPSAIPVSVDFTLAGSATQATDYTLAPGTVTFPANSMIQQLALGVVDDALNEANETVAITLVNPTNALLGATPATTYTIMDDDPEPDVSIITSSMSSPEGTATVTLTVKLSAPSGRMVSVPFAASSTSTATNPDDYTYMTPSPLVFPAGSTTQMITISVVNDLMDEQNETVVTALGTPTNAMLGSPATQTLTIVDDDLACYGTGNSMVCID